MVVVQHHTWYCHASPGGDAHSRGCVCVMQPLAAAMAAKHPCLQHSEILSTLGYNDGAPPMPALRQISLHICSLLASPASTAPRFSHHRADRAASCLATSGMSPSADALGSRSPWSSCLREGTPFSLICRRGPAGLRLVRTPLTTPPHPCLMRVPSAQAARVLYKICNFCSSPRTVKWK